MMRFATLFLAPSCSLRELDLQRILQSWADKVFRARMGDRQLCRKEVLEIRLFDYPQRVF